MRRTSVTGHMGEIDYDAFDALTFDCYGTLIDWETRHPGRAGAAPRRRRPRGRARALRAPRGPAGSRPVPALQGGPGGLPARAGRGARLRADRRRGARLRHLGHRLARVRRQPGRRSSSSSSASSSRSSPTATTTCSPPPTAASASSSTTSSPPSRRAATSRATENFDVRLRAHRRPARAHPARRPEPVPRPRAGEGARDDDGLDRPPPGQGRRRCDAARGRPARRDVPRPARASRAPLLRRVSGVAFDSLYTHGFARVAAAVPHLRPAEPVFNVERTLALGEPGVGRARGAGRLPRARALGVRDRRLLPAGRADRRRAGRAWRAIVEASRELFPVLVGRRAAARASTGSSTVAFVIHRGARARRRPQELPAQLPRVLRGAPVPRRARVRSATASSCSGRRSRSAATCSSRAADLPGLRAPRRDLRGRLDAAPAEHLRRAGGRDRAREPVGEQHHDRQGRLPAHAVHGAVRAHDRGLHLHGRGRGRVDDRPRVGRAGADLRERRPASPRPSASATEEQLLLRRRRPRPDRLRPREHEQLRGLDPRPPRAARALPARRRSSSAPARRADAAAAHDRALPVRPRRPAEPQRALLRGLQHPGPRPRDAPARDRDREGRDRRLGRPGLDARADRRRARDGPARPAARERARLHDARLRHLRPHQGQRLEADAGARRDRARDRHPARRRSRCCATSSTRTPRARSSTTSPSRTSRPASAPRTCSGSPTTTAGS